MNDINIAELKQITESSNIQADADPNKLHYDELRNMSSVWDKDEAMIVASELAKKYPDIMLDQLTKRISTLANALSGIKTCIGDI